jgi:mono/diheme cytochrome c family protein
MKRRFGLEGLGLERLVPAFVAAAAFACGSPRRSEAQLGPMEIESSSVARGRLVYARACDECHPGGTAGLGPALNNKPLPAFLIRFQVRHGMGSMPSFSEREISDSELADLAVYVRARRAYE